MGIPMTKDHVAIGSGELCDIHQSKEQLRPASLQQKPAKSRELGKDSYLPHHPPSFEVMGA